MAKKVTKKEIPFFERTDIKLGDRKLTFKEKVKPVVKENPIIIIKDSLVASTQNTPEPLSEPMEHTNLTCSFCGRSFIKAGNENLIGANCPKCKKGKYE